VVSLCAARTAAVHAGGKTVHAGDTDVRSVRIACGHDNRNFGSLLPRWPPVSAERRYYSLDVARGNELRHCSTGYKLMVPGSSTSRRLPRPTIATTALPRSRPISCGSAACQQLTSPHATRSKTREPPIEAAPSCWRMNRGRTEYQVEVLRREMSSRLSAPLCSVSTT